MTHRDDRAADAGADPDDDAGALAALGAGLAPVDVDATTAAHIARRARQDVGKGRPRRRWILPIAAAVAVAGYLVWLLASVLDVFR